MKKILLMGASILALGITSAAAQQPAPRSVTEPMTSPEIQAQAQTPAPTQSPTTTSAPTTHLSQPIATGIGVGAFYGYNRQDSGGNESHLTGLNLDYDFGLTQGLAFTVQQAVFWNFLAESNGVGGRSVGGLKLNLGDGQGALPYIGANFGGIYGKGISDSLLAGPEIGLNLFGLNAKVAYDMPFNRSWDDGVVVAILGFGLRF